MKSKTDILKVAVATPLHSLFDYLPPAGGPSPQPGQRVSVSFGRRKQIGVIAGLADHSEVPAAKLKRVDAVLDTQPLLDAQLVELLNWASDYYQFPPGEVFAAALPGKLRKGEDAQAETLRVWSLTEAGADADCTALQKRAPVQAVLLSTLLRLNQATDAQLEEAHEGWRNSVRALKDKGLVCSDAIELAPAPATPAVPSAFELTNAQRAAVEDMPSEHFTPCLLEGVTGSGKTEVYLRLIEKQIAANRQTLVLVPEIGLTPQLLQRFEERLEARIAVMHSGLNDTERFASWLSARNGQADVIIGTRSAIFVPLPRPGLIIIDEEHDGSFKQQDGFKYSARDLAVWRARQLDIPIMLGSATPSFETLHNALTKRYRHMLLPERPGSARQPDLHVIDLRTYPPTEGISQPLHVAIGKHLDAGNQVLVYLNRRGFAPTLLCPSCGETQECPRCDARMVLHQNRRRLACHHCGIERPMIDKCADCDVELVPIGQGTERLEDALTARYPDHALVRIDRDTTRRKGELERRLESVRVGDARILLGTQMLTKGHDFPDVTCVAIIDSDQGLFGTDFRSSERLGQSILQVSGRAGRADKPGEVWLQTWYPEHPLLGTLLTAGYATFAEEALAERAAAAWPPYSHLTLLRAEAADRDVLFGFLGEARQIAERLPNSGVRILGPASSPMEKRSGRYRGQLLLQSTDRAGLRSFLPAWRYEITGLKSGRKARWSLDVDPLELF